MIKTIINKLKENGSTIAFAESITGGKLSSQIVEIAGASKVFKGSIVAYSNEIKNRVLYIDQNDIKTYGVVSKEIAFKMAQSVQKLYGTTYSLGITGDAGPTIQEDMQKRCAFYSICGPEECKTFELNFNEETRIEAIDYACKEAFKSLNEFISKSA